ncbi:MAG: T9SS type A sorting domain-containing protein [Bacteroidia bacterium]|nr:T9SS type A sorting domain-containing protein [Bacteroidia bacterium]
MAVYPNPFSEFTNIRYKLNTESNVMIKVFDATGRDIETVVNSMQTVGEYHYKFDSQKNNYKVGTYIIQMMVNKSVYLKKIIIE